MEVSYPPVMRYRTKMAEMAERPFHVADPKWLEIWEKTGAGEGVDIGIIDTGVDETHAELKDSIASLEDCTGSRSGPRDVDGHGTHTASTITGKTCGIAPKARLHVIKGLNDEGIGNDRWIVDGGMKLIDDRKVSILSMSLGSSWPSPLLQRLVEYAVNKGVIVFAASGNEGATRVGYPAGYDVGCVAVGAVDRQFNVARFSNAGQSLDYANYGVKVWGAAPGGGFVLMSGTSMSCPGQSGGCANIQSMELKLSGSIYTRSLEAYARFNGDTIDLGAVGRDDQTGYGFHVPEKIVKRIEAQFPKKPALPQPEDPVEGNTPILEIRGRNDVGHYGIYKTYFVPDAE